MTQSEQCSSFLLENVADWGVFFRQFAWQRINFYKKLLYRAREQTVIFPSCCSFLAKVPDIWGKGAFSLGGAWKAQGQERRITGSAIYITATNCVLRLSFSEALLLPIIPINILELNGSNYISLFVAILILCEKSQQLWIQSDRAQVSGGDIPL